MYTKERFGTWLESDVIGLNSSRFNPLLFEKEPNTVIGSTDKTINRLESQRLRPRHRLKYVGADKLFSRMLIAQPPVTYASVGCNTVLFNTDGIRVSDLVHAMEIESDYVCALGHAFSFAVPRVLFPTREEEKEARIVRWRTELAEHCGEGCGGDECRQFVVALCTSDYSVYSGREIGLVAQKGNALHAVQ